MTRRPPMMPMPLASAARRRGEIDKTIAAAN
jgi:hypothetical protein